MLRTNGFVTALVALCLQAAHGMAQSQPVPAPPSEQPTPIPCPGDTPTCPDPMWPDLHANNRAVAFGSIVMANGGLDVGAWKQIRAYRWCDASTGTPGAPDTGEAPAGEEHRAGDTDDTTLACWEVLATTAYDMVVCPDGRAFITRQGEGVALTDRTHGDLFSWSEAVACDDDGLGRDALNRSRPLDRRNLRRTSR